MAPELVDGAEVSRSSDLYTVGCLLYELLTGTRPFASADLMREIDRSRRESPPPLGRADVPWELRQVTLVGERLGNRYRCAGVAFVRQALYRLVLLSHVRPGPAC
jgi:serine/threonine protein kinase